MNKRKLEKIGKKGLAAVLVATSLMSVSVPVMAAEVQENLCESVQTESAVQETDMDEKEKTEKKMSRAEAEKMFAELKSQGWTEGSEANTLSKIENGVKTTISYTLSEERIKSETPVVSKMDFRTKKEAINHMKEQGLEDIEVEEVKSWSCNRMMTFATAEEAAKEHRKLMSELRLKNKDEMVMENGFYTGKYGGISPGICTIDQLGERELNVAMYGGSIKMRSATYDYFIPKMYEMICQRFDVTKDQVFFTGTVIDEKQFAYGPAKVKVTVKKSADSVYELTYYPTEDSTKGDITYVLTDAIRRCPLTEEYTKTQLKDSDQNSPNEGQAKSYGFYVTEQQYGYRGKGYTYTTEEIANVITTKEKMNTEQVSEKNPTDNVFGISHTVTWKERTDDPYSVRIVKLSDGTKEMQYFMDETGEIINRVPMKS